MIGALKVCNDKTCPNLTEHRYCTEHTRDDRPSAAARGYNNDWAKRRAVFLRDNPTCIDCGSKATVPDHSPASRKQLVAMGVADPDDAKHLEPRCARCHNKRTGQQAS